MHISMLLHKNIYSDICLSYFIHNNKFLHSSNVGYRISPFSTCEMDEVRDTYLSDTGGLLCLSSTSHDSCVVLPCVWLLYAA